MRDRHACKFGQTHGCQMIIDKDPRAWRSSQDFLMFLTGLSRGQAQRIIKSDSCRGEEMGHFLYGEVFFLARCRLTHFRQQEDHFHKSRWGGREIAVTERQTKPKYHKQSMEFPTRGTIISYLKLGKGSSKHYKRFSHAHE